VRQLVPPAGDVDDLESHYAPPDDRHLRMGFVQSLDGAIAVGGKSKGLQSPADLRVFRTLRAVSDAVMVGAGTARHEGYGPVRLTPEGLAWRERTGRDPDVPLIVVSRSGGRGLDVQRLAPSTIVLTSEAGARVTDVPFEQVACGIDQVDLAAGMDELAARGYRRIICEGGPTLFSDLLALGLVDELCLTVSPLLAGGVPPMLATPPDQPAPLRLVSLLQEDDVLLGRWALG
jgi:riboflavin biosynthesis pyrimidine reductase